MKTKTLIVPAGREAAYSSYHYAPAVRVGDLIFVSGVPATGPGTYREQVTRMFERLRTTLEAAGASMEDLVELQTFHAATTASDLQNEVEEFLAVYRQFVPSLQPAWTAVGNASLFAAGAVMEARVTAVAGSGKGARVKAAFDEN
jgi:enamine deaminase RidA (YjgF/YER057c/UK114 family)